MGQPPRPEAVQQPPTGVMADIGVQQSPVWQTCCAGQPTLVLQSSPDKMYPLNKKKPTTQCRL